MHFGEAKRGELYVMAVSKRHKIEPKAFIRLAEQAKNRENIAKSHQKILTAM